MLTEVATPRSISVPKHSAVLYFRAPLFTHDLQKLGPRARVDLTSSRREKMRGNGQTSYLIMFQKQTKIKKKKKSPACRTHWRLIYLYLSSSEIDCTWSPNPNPQPLTATANDEFNELKPVRCIKEGPENSHIQPLMFVHHLLALASETVHRSIKQSILVIKLVWFA